MAFTVVRDIEWPFVGDTVKLSTVGTVGQRTRYRLTGKPDASAMALFDVKLQNYNITGQFTVDADGTYTIVADDEKVSVNVPHYSNQGGPGLNTGGETYSIDTSTTYTLHVGRVLEREIGISPHTCTIQVHAHNGTDVLTESAGADLCPTLINPSGDVASMAIQSTEVKAVMALWGGIGWTGASTAQTEAWTQIAWASPYAQLQNLVAAFAAHIFTKTGEVHNGNTATHVITKANAVPGAGLAGLIDLLNDLLIQIESHRLQFNNTYNAGTNGHQTPDDVNTGLSGVFPLVFGIAVQGDCDIRANLIKSVYNAHVKQIYPSTGYTPILSGPYMDTVHGDGRAGGGGGFCPTIASQAAGIDVCSTVNASNNATCCALANALKVSYMLHQSRNNLTNALAYHGLDPNDGTGSKVWWLQYLQTTTQGYIDGVARLMDAMDLHFANKDDDGAETLWHTGPDTSNWLSQFPRPATFQDAIRSHELCQSRFYSHLAAGGVVHPRTTNSAGATALIPYSGVGLIQEMFLQWCWAPPTVPPGQQTGVANLVTVGGWDLA